MLKNKKIFQFLKRHKIILIISIIIITIIFSFLSGTTNSGPDLSKEIKSVNAIYKEGKFQEAQIEYNKLIKLSPRNSTLCEKLGKIALWNNQFEEAIDYFNKAEKYSPWLYKIWPFNLSLKMSIGTIYYRMDKYKEASQYAKEAVGPFAIGPLKDIKAMYDQLSLFKEKPPYVIDGPDEDKIKFIITDPIPIIEIYVNDKGPYHFFIDSGTADIILDSRLAKDLNAEIAGTIVGKTPATSTDVGLGRVESLQIGNFHISNAPIQTIDLSDVSEQFKEYNIRPSGLLGTRIFMHFISTIDYVNGYLILKKKTEANLEKLEILKNKPGTMIIPFWQVETHYLVAWGQINNSSPMLFFIDTGIAGNSFTAPESVLNDVGIKIDWENAGEGHTVSGGKTAVNFNIDELSFGLDNDKIVKKNCIGVASKTNVSIYGDRLGFFIGGGIGHQFFRDRAMTFDFENMVLVIHENSALEMK